MTVMAQLFSYIGIQSTLNAIDLQIKGRIRMRYRDRIRPLANTGIDGDGYFPGPIEFNKIKELLCYSRNGYRMAG